MTAIRFEQLLARLIEMRRALEVNRQKNLKALWHHVEIK